MDRAAPGMREWPAKPVNRRTPTKGGSSRNTLINRTHRTSTAWLVSVNSKEQEDFFPLLQLRVLCLGLLQDGNVRVGVFPEREEIFVGGFCFGRVALQGVSARQSEASQRAPRKVPHQSSVVNEFLKFCCRSVAVVQHEIGFATQIHCE